MIYNDDKINSQKLGNKVLNNAANLYTAEKNASITNERLHFIIYYKFD